MDTDRDKPASTSSSLAPHAPSKSVDSNESENNRDEAISIQLARLRAHFPRQETSETQSTIVNLDFLVMLEPYTVEQIIAGTNLYIADPKSQFMPTPGQLIGKIKSSVTYSPTPQRRHVHSQQLSAPLRDNVPPGRLRSVDEVLADNTARERYENWKKQRGM